MLFCTITSTIKVAQVDWKIAETAIRTYFNSSCRDIMGSSLSSLPTFPSPAFSPRPTSVQKLMPVPPSSNGIAAIPSSVFPSPQRIRSPISPFLFPKSPLGAPNGSAASTSTSAAAVAAAASSSSVRQKQSSLELLGPQLSSSLSSPSTLSYAEIFRWMDSFVAEVELQVHSHHARIPCGEYTAWRYLNYWMGKLDRRREINEEGEDSAGALKSRELMLSQGYGEGLFYIVDCFERGHISPLAIVKLVKLVEDASRKFRERPEAKEWLDAVSMLKTRIVETEFARLQCFESATNKAALVATQGGGSTSTSQVPPYLSLLDLLTTQSINFLERFSLQTTAMQNSLGAGAAGINYPLQILSGRTKDDLFNAIQLSLIHNAVQPRGLLAVYWMSFLLLTMQRNVDNALKAILSEIYVHVLDYIDRNEVIVGQVASCLNNIVIPWFMMSSVSTCSGVGQNPPDFVPKVDNPCKFLEKLRLAVKNSMGEVKFNSYLLINQSLR